LATLTQLLDAIETSLSDARSGIKPDEVISTYFKIAKKQMEETKVKHCGRFCTYQFEERGACL
jgi:uncharacterized Zn finger protein